jgi:hypothetical protein
VTLRKLVEAAPQGRWGNGPFPPGPGCGLPFHADHGRGRPGFEEASRALFAGEAQTFEERITGWPADIRAHILYLASRNTPDSPSA